MPTIQNDKSTLDFLGTIGDRDYGDGTLGLSNSAVALATLAGVIIADATDNLERNGNTATGNTATSMKARDIVTTGAKMELDIEIAATYKFINDGVKGTQAGAGKYSFKSNKVSKKMAKAILAWMKVRSLSGKTKYKAVSKNEAKNKRLNKVLSEAKSRESLSYAIATNIKKKGIKRTRFFSKAIESAKREQKKLFADALKLDIIESLNGLN